SETTPQTPCWQEIRDDDFYVFCMFQVLAQCAFDGALSASGAAEEDLLRWPGDGFLGIETAQTHEAFVAKLGPRKHFVEGRRQVHRQRPDNFEADVTPTLADAIAFVFRRDIETSDERDVFVADEELAMIANREAVQRERIKPSHLGTDGLQR